jgi:hypothetical protein
MLSAQDDLIGHQTPTPFAQAGNGDPRYTERYWYTAHPIDGSDMIIDMGMGYYPNRGVMDAFAGITVGRVQYSFRASRQLGDQPLQTAVGPISFQVLEGMKRHRLCVADNESGFSCDIEFEASFPAAREKQNYRERHGVVEEDLLRMAQFGRFRGWFVINGQRHVVEPSRWWGQRDHSWGLRTQLRTDSAHPPMSPLKNFFWTWSMLQFENLGLSVFFREREPGKPGYLSGSEFVRAADGQVHKREVTAVAHDVQWLDDPLGQTIAFALLRFDFDHGPPRDVKLEGLKPRFFLKAGLYGGLNGWQHGDDRGAYASAHEVWNLDDAATRRTACTLSDQVMRATSDGMVGYGISEYGVADGYPLYLAPQKFPAF